MNLKNKPLLLLNKPTEKKTFPIQKGHVTMPEKGENLPYRELSRDNDQKRCLWKKRNAAPTSFFNFHWQNQFTSFSYQHSIFFTYGLQHYCFLGQANLYGLCGLWQMSRQIWTIFLVQKRFQTLGCKAQSFQEKWQQRVSTGPKSYTVFSNIGGKLTNFDLKFSGTSMSHCT